MMTDAFQLRKWAIFALIIPVAIVIGVSLASPLDTTTLGVIGLFVCAILFPIVLRWHHALLIVAWNATITLYFLPGSPDLWMIMTVTSLFVTVLKKTLTNQRSFTHVKYLSWPIAVLCAVVIATAIARRIMVPEIGFSNEVRRYLLIVFAILGFFALSFQKIPKKQAMFFAGLFFLSGTMAVLSDIVFLAGPKFYFLYNFLPAGLALLQASAELSMRTDTIFRMEGVAWASVAFCCFLLIRYGARGLLDIRFPWRIALFVAAVAAGLLGGFRSRLFFVGMLFVVQFCFEGLWRTRRFPILLGVVVILACSVLPFAQKLPLPIQRTLSFLPVEVDPIVKKDAEETLVWRTEMWRAVLPEVPQYLWLGKGYMYSASDHYLGDFAIRRGWVKSYETFILTGEYHNGPLSILVPFGIWGLAAFVWFVGAGWLALYRNYKFGEKDLQKINTFLLTYYSVRAIFFFAVYGAFHAELIMFTGTLGLSLAINGGVRAKTSSSISKPADPVSVRAF